MYAVDAERDLLAAMLSDGAARDEALPPAVYGGDLVGIGHTEIFASIVGLHTASDEVDAHSVAGILRSAVTASRPLARLHRAALGVLDDLPLGGGAETSVCQYSVICQHSVDRHMRQAPEPGRGGGAGGCDHDAATLTKVPAHRRPASRHLDGQASWSTSAGPSWSTSAGPSWTGATSTHLHGPEKGLARAVLATPGQTTYPVERRTCEHQPNTQQRQRVGHGGRPAPYRERPGCEGAAAQPGR